VVPPKVKLVRCGNARSFGFRCGRVEVPLERADPSLGTTPVAFAIRRRTDRDRPSAGTIVAVEGGPGYSSKGSAETYVSLFGRLLRRRDLLLVDMRGTGGSGLMPCTDAQRRRAPDWISMAQCARRLGPGFASYRTAAAADDIDSVRRALRIGQISLYGDSYGTYLAQSYAFRHGDTLDALVLDSAYPVRGESGWYPSILRTGIRALEIACDRSPECSGDAPARLERFVARLRHRHESAGPIIDAIGDAGYDPPSSYVEIDKAIAAGLAGNQKPYKQLTASGGNSYGHVREYSHAAELAFSCNDYPMIWHKAASEAQRRVQLEEAIRAYPKDRFAPFTPREVALSSHLGYLACLTWPRPGGYYEPPADPDATAPRIPVLVVSGELDDVTSPWEGRHAAAEFPNSTLYVARNAGHVASLYDYGGPPARRIRRFLRRHS
jgi:pimeloyl-ACP methyl ester carboxylesterase